MLGRRAAHVAGPQGEHRSDPSQDSAAPVPLARDPRDPLGKKPDATHRGRLPSEREALPGAEAYSSDDPDGREADDHWATVESGRVPSIADEIALVVSRRDMVDRYFVEKLARGENVDLLKYMSFLSTNGLRIVRMLQIQDKLSEHTDDMSALFDGALDEVSRRLGVEL